MVEIKLNKSNENPFYGMKYCLNLMQNADKVITDSMISSAFAECKTKEQKELFYTLLFSIGDITARQHNIFKGKKKDNGGNANRDGFTVILDWLWKNDNKQFLKFLSLGLFEEYTCFDHLLKNRVQTKKNKVTRIFNILRDAKYRNAIADHLYAIINGTNPFNKMLVAKFLTLPRLTKRSGHKKMLPETKEVMENKVQLLIELSNLMGWEYDVDATTANFKGYRAWRKEYNGDFESVLFSTGKIKEFDENEFKEWLNKLPAQARYRVKNRVFYSKIKDTETLKYPQLKKWFEEWEAYKEKMQQEQRVLEERVRQGQATDEDKEKLIKVKKEAKVTTGATNFNEIYDQICRGDVDKLKLESFMAKVNLPYNSLVIIDDSGSMSGAPFNFASFIAAVCLCKNPDDDGRNLLGFFNTSTHWHSYIDKKASNTPNSILRRNDGVRISPKPFYDPNKSFYDNYKDIASFCRSVFANGCTNISAIPEGLKYVCDRNPEILDALKSYPVWTIISDGEWNNLSSPEASMNDFMRKCETYFGFKPFVVAIDAKKGWGWNDRNIDRFSGIDNMIYIPANIAQIEQFLTNFRDMDVFDVYTPLQSMYRSNRYELVRNAVL